MKTLMSPEHVAALITMDDGEFEQYYSVLGQVVRWRRELVPIPVSAAVPVSMSATVSAVESHPVVTQIAQPSFGGSLVPRRLMGEPRPGSLRAVIHGVLRSGNGKSMRRSEIIAAVAQRIGGAPDTLEPRVSEVLRTTHDPHIKKSGYGLYVYVAAGKEVSA
jgi:hypothetical protein